jgi:hypothetical protein
VVFLSFSFYFVVCACCCGYSLSRLLLLTMRGFDDGSIDEFDDDVFPQPPPPAGSAFSRYDAVVVHASHGGE